MGNGNIVRKFYRKPAIEKVELLVEEAVFVTCKTGNQPASGTIGNPVNNCNAPQQGCQKNNPS